MKAPKARRCTMWWPSTSRASRPCGCSPTARSRWWWPTMRATHPAEGGPDMIARRFLLAGLLLFAAFPAMAGDKVHRLALQISDDSPDKMNTVLGNATNAARYYSEKGEKLEIKVVAYSGGLAMLRADKSPVLERLKSVSKDIPNIT